MTELGLDDLGEYERRLSQSELELQELIEEVVVPESWFFRDERPFQWLREYVRERWLNDLLRPPLRVLSLPCAGGRRALLDRHDAPGPGPSSPAIPDRRRRRQRSPADDRPSRRFTRSMPSAVDLSYRARYFREHPQGYELDPDGPGDGPVHPGECSRSRSARGIAPLRRVVLPQSSDLSRRLGPRARAGGDRPAACR